MAYRDNPHHEIEMVISFDYLNVFKPNEHTEDYHIWKPNNENFLFEIEVKKMFMWQKKYLLLKQKIQF